MLISKQDSYGMNSLLKTENVERTNRKEHVGVEYKTEAEQHTERFQWRRR
jgi:hypothetical protein